MKQPYLINTFIDQSKDLFWMINLNFQLIYANKSYLSLIRDMTGVEQKLNESIFLEGIFEAYTEKWKAYYHRAFMGERFEIEEHFFDKNANTIKYNQITFEPLTGDDHEIFAVACQSRDITNIVKQKSEAHLLIDASLDVFCTVNEQGHFVYVSGGAINHWGYTPQELMGKSFQDLLLEEDMPKTEEIIAELHSGREVKSFVNRYKKKNGDIAYNLWSARWDDTTKLRYAVARDCKEKIEQEQAIQQSEQRFKALIQEGSDLVAILSADGYYSYISPSSKAVLGIAAEDYIGKNTLDFIHPDDLETALASLQKITTEKRVVVKPFRFQNHKKEWRWVEAVLTNMLDNPAVNGIVSNSRDITDKIEEEHTLKLLKSVITNTRDAVIITEAEPFDEPGPKIIYVNEAFTKMTGYEAQEVIGQSPRMFQGPNSNREELKKLGLAIRNWEPYEMTTINYKKSGEEFWINFTVIPVTNEKGSYTHWIAIERDVTDQKIKELETELLAQISENFNTEVALSSAAKELCKSISKFGDFDWVEVWTINLEKSQMQLLSHCVAAPEDEQFYDHTNEIDTFKKTEGLVGKVWSQRTEVLWNDIENNKNFVRRDAAKKIGLKAVLGIPLIFNNEAVGVLKIGTKKSYDYLNNYIQIFKELETFIGSELNRKKLENDLRNLFNAIPDIICVLDFQGRFLKINTAGCELLGYSEEELLYHKFDEFVHQEDKGIFKREAKLHKKKETTFKFENRYITNKGKITWLSWYCNSARQEGLIYATATDITEEKKLRELNRQASQLAKIGSWEVDVINESIFWSDEVHLLHETDLKRYVPNLEDSINFYRDDFREMVELNTEKCISTGASFDFEAVLITAKNKERWVRAIGSGEFVDGVCKRIYGSFQDIQERKEAEIRLQSLADNLPGVVFQYLRYPDGTEALKYVTKGSKEVWGYSSEEVIQNNQLVRERIVAGGEFEKVKKSIIDSIQFKTKWNARWKYVMPTGELQTHLGYGTPSFLADGTILFNSIVLNITQESKNEELLAQTTEMARIGSWELDLLNQDGDTMYWSPMVKKILEVDQSYNPTLTGGLEFYSGESKQKIENATANLIDKGHEFDEELLVVTNKGRERWIRCIGKSEMANKKRIKIYGSFQDIHIAKSLELKISEILGSISDAFYAVDKDWKFTYFNKQAERLFQHEEKDVLGKNIWELFPSAVNSKLYGAYHDITQSLVSQTFEYLFPGDGKWYEISAYPSVGGLSVYFKNIDERKEAAEKLQKAFEEKTNILESIGDAFFAVDNNWIVTYWNKEAELILGRKKEHIVGKQLWEEYADAIDMKFYREYHKAMETKQVTSFEAHYPTINIWVEVSAYPSDEGLSVYFKDVTLRKEADIQLQLANERFEKVTEATNDAIWDWDISNQTFYRSKAIERFLGKEAFKSFTENNFWKDKFHPDDLVKLKNSVEEAVSDPKCTRWELEYRLINEKNNILYVIDRGVIVRNNSGEAIRMVGAMTDITEQKHMELQLSELNQSLQQYTHELERSNQELEQFAFVTSHDLQEPLRMISSFMDLLQRKYGEHLDEKAHKYIYFATDGAKRMKQIILDLLEYSRATRPTEGKEVVNLNEVLTEFKQLRRKLISEKSAKIKSNALPTLNIHKAVITQILHCLVDNALKYTKVGTSPLVEMRATERKKEWEFSIKDNGIGIDSQFYDKIFIIFQRLHNQDQYGGTGIGLSIAKRHVEFLGGQIWLESVPDEGTVFYFTIPKIK